MIQGPVRRRATSYDVAIAAGVAQSTVSRCFRDGSNISPDTRAKVFAVAERIGYVPNAMARSLITRRSDMVGVIATRFTLRGNPDLIHALGASLSGAGKSLLLLVVENDWPEAASLRGALEYPLDGLISCAMIEDGLVRRIQQRGVSVVFLNRSVTMPQIDWIKTDNAAAARDVAERLVAAGHRRFLCIAGPIEAPVSRERIEGFVAGLATAGLAAPDVRHADYSYAGGHDAILAHLREAPAPDAVFCANDQLALGAMDALRFDLRLRVPQDVSVVGFDDVAEGSRPTYELTTLRQSSVEIAHAAVDLLLRRLIDPGAASQRVMVPATLIRRGSARLA